MTLDEGEAVLVPGRNSSSESEHGQCRCTIRDLRSLGDAVWLRIPLRLVPCRAWKT